MDDVPARRESDLDVGRHGRNGLVTFGGIAFVIAGGAYLVITVTGAMIGVSPGDNVRWLAALAARPTLSIVTYGVLTGVADLGLIPAVLALYLTLARFRRSAMLLASVILLVYVAVDMSTFVPTAIALTRLSATHATTTDIAQRTALTGAMTYGVATIPFSQFFGWFFPSLGYLLVAWTLRTARLAARVAVLGFLAAAFDIAGSLSFLWPGQYWDTFVTPGLALLGLFQVFAGLLLLRLARQPLGASTSQLQRLQAPTS